MGVKLETAALILGLSMMPSPAAAIDNPSTKGTTVDIADHVGVMSSGAKGEKELADMVLYYQLAAQTLVPMLEMPNMCPGVKDGIAVKPGVATPNWGTEIPVETKILTH